MLLSDIELLQLAEKVVKRYVYSGAVPYTEFDDFKMGIVEKFLQKQDRIEAQFSGRASIKTYCIAVLNRMCCEIIRKEVKHWRKEPELNERHAPTEANISSNYTVIHDETLLLDKCITLFDTEQHKIRLFLSYYYQLPLHPSDMKAYAGRRQQSQVKKWLTYQHKISKGERFVNLAKVVNLIEKKSVHADAVRIWLNKSIQRIITRLNGPHRRANYDKDTFHILFEYYAEHRKEGGEMLTRHKNIASHDIKK